MPLTAWFSAFGARGSSFHFILQWVLQIMWLAVQRRLLGRTPWVPEVHRLQSSCSARCWQCSRFQLHFCGEQPLLHVFFSTQATVFLMIFKDHSALLPLLSRLLPLTFFQHFRCFRGTNKPIKELSALAGLWCPAVWATCAEPQAGAAVSQQDTFSVKFEGKWPK